MSPTLQFTPAQSLEDVYRTLDPQPLETEQELQAFYRPELNEVRGGDKLGPLWLQLKRQHGQGFCRAFVCGHQGVGKSTELSRLCNKPEVSALYRPIRINAIREFDPAGFRPFDVVLLMMSEIFAACEAARESKELDWAPDDTELRQVLDWFATETDVIKTAQAKAIELSAGAGLSEESLLAKVLGLFASLKGEMKFSSSRETSRTEYRLTRLSSLIEIANRFVLGCNQALRDATGQEWLFIVEGLDRQEFPRRQIEGLFITAGNIFRDLQAHFVFTIPIDLAYSSLTAQLPLPKNMVFSIPDTPVFDRTHSAHVAGRDALHAVLTARVSIDLFENGQCLRLAVASGGNIRDLFALVATAADLAILDGRIKISARDVERAKNDMRTEYLHRLGESPYDPDPLSYEHDKVPYLLKIYEKMPSTEPPSPVLHVLLRARAIQEFNGENWYGVHPLVVDVLERQGYLQVPGKGPVPGGTE